jgi:gliding motility-associated-like protein
LSFITTIKKFKPNISCLLLVATVLLFFFVDCEVKAQTSQFTVTAGNPISLPAFSAAGCNYKWVNNNPAMGLNAQGTGNITPFTAVNNTGLPINATITAIPTGDGFAYIANGVTDDVSVISTLDHTLVKKIPVGNLPWGVAVSPDGKHVYVTNTNTVNGHSQISTLSTIDAATNTTIGSPVNLGKNAGSIAISPDGKTAYIANKSSNEVSVINLATGSIFTLQLTYALGVAVSNDGKRLYVTADSNTSNGKLYIMDTSDFSIIQTVQIETNVTGIVISPDGNKAYITNDYKNTISVIDTKTYGVNVIPVGDNPYAIAISPDGGSVYVANTASNSVSVVNTATNAVTSLSLPSQPHGIAVSPDGKEVYVAGQVPDEVEVINTANNQISSVSTGGSGAISIGNFVSAGVGCNNLPVTYSITVNPLPVISDPGSVSSTLSTRYGTPSTAQVINVGGNYLTAGILVTAPAGFELSIDDITFSNTLTIGAAGNVAPVEVFVRLKSTAPVGTPSGNITLTTAGAATVNVPVDGAIIKIPLIIAAENKTKFFGDVNPVLTIKYTGFVNNDGPAQLITQPVISTTATTTSPVGQYPITVSGAVAANYSITSYVPGVLEIFSGDVSLPNAFTPNGDGINDTWDVKNLNLYASCTVEIINRYGNKIFQSIGYAAAWDGRYNSADLPVGIYYYIIRLRNGAKPITGYVAIIR